MAPSHVRQKRGIELVSGCTRRSPKLRAVRDFGTVFEVVRGAWAERMGSTCETTRTITRKDEQAAIASAYDWTGVTSAVDVGEGALLASIVAGNPGVRSMAVPVTNQPLIQVGKPKPLFEARGVGGMSSYEVTCDGKRFLVNRNIGEASQDTFW